MTHQQQWQAYPPDSSASTSNLSSNTQGDDTVTFVKLPYEGLSRPFTPYTYTEGDIPPPPPYLYQQFPYQSRRNKGFVITIVLLALLVVGFGTLEGFQVSGWNLLSHDPHRSLGSNQTSMTSALHTSVSLKATPVRTLTQGTMKENVLLSCEVCDDPILTTINTITIDTTNMRLIWVVKLNNVSGSEQVDTFNDFNVQDPNGTIYEGTGKLNTVFILSGGQTVLATEIFSFLPRPGVPYTLITRLGVSGRTYDPVQFTF